MSLKQETVAIQQRSDEQVTAKERENNDLTRVVGELQGKTQEHQQAAEDVKLQAEKEVAGMSSVAEGLQNEIKFCSIRSKTKDMHGSGAKMSPNGCKRGMINLRKTTRHYNRSGRMRQPRRIAILRS